ncbi:MFS transporter [Mycobacteroides chelonae]|jgi:MFS family permease|uniref:MFS transporter n=1 Tax=Mycobacteroides chelonae TaxID=1774 RepID=A0A1S1KUY6_MYCCH|nr:MFS transporter [Mycobacteroides chelonae]AMW21687.1 major facilitator superfamily protein [Mycobacterium sp. QIA-37]PKQ60094.1 MFS transporter [Mycobacterium sp. MHSD3]AYM43769.1 MFS transporter [[Mycobacterium] chelonae subsp. gwanakae]MBF9523344.1 MFS transporter [Mycobacteroides chelonae]MBV0915684.1 MFS transporter [Mycobacteroides chelonae]
MRIAVIGVFASFGLVVATWAVHLPTMKQATGMSSTALGLVVLVLGGGALVGMLISGVLVDRFGSGPIAVAGGAAMALGVNIPLSATNVWIAGAGAFLCGVAVGVTDVAMNAAAVDVERFYGRPIMASFHGVFSVGNVVGAGIGTVAFAVHVPVFVTVLGVTVLCLVVLGSSASVLLKDKLRVGEAEAPDTVPYTLPPAVTCRRGQVFLLGVLAMLLMLSEGSATDWSSLHAQEHLGASHSWGAFTFGVFMAAMTVGRFTVDKLVERVGRVLVLRWGCALAAVGLLTVIASPALPLTMAGWAAVGLGLAGGVPQVFTVAGNIDEQHEGRVLSWVVGTGYVAVLGGPALIGWLADALSLNTALLLPIFAVLVCGCAAGALTMSAPATKTAPKAGRTVKP